MLKFIQDFARWAAWLVSGSAGLLFLILLRQQAGHPALRPEAPPPSELDGPTFTPPARHRPPRRHPRRPAAAQSDGPAGDRAGPARDPDPGLLLPAFPAAGAGPRVHARRGGPVSSGSPSDARPEEIYVFELHPDSLRSFAQAVDAETRVRKLSGPSRRPSRWPFSPRAGIAQLANKLADIFSCEVDFFTEVRRGDKFTLLVEETLRRRGLRRHTARSSTGGTRATRPRQRGLLPGRKGRGAATTTSTGNNLRRAFLKSPLTYRRISSYFAKKRFHPILQDLPAPPRRRLRGARAGRRSSRWRTGSSSTRAGRADTAGSSRSATTAPTRRCYGHLSRFAANVRSGARVKQGDKIGYVGQTGLATGPHLHYEFVENGQFDQPPRDEESLPSEPIASRLSCVDFRRLVAEMSAAESEMAARATCLVPEAWAGLLAQNSAVAAQVAAD